MDGFALVTAGHHQAGQGRNGRCEQLQVGAQVGDGAGFDAQQGAIFFHRHFIVGDLVAAMNGGRSVFAARFDPLDRRAQTHGQMAAQGFLGVEIELGPEAAAYLRRDDADFVFRHGDHAWQQRAHQVRNLGRGPKRERALASVPGSDAAARLDGHWSEPLMNHALLDDAVRRFERGGDVPVGELPGVSEVGAQLGMGQR